MHLGYGQNNSIISKAVLLSRGHRWSDFLCLLHILGTNSLTGIPCYELFTTQKCVPYSTMLKEAKHILHQRICTRQEGNNRRVESVWGKKKGYSNKTLLAKAAVMSSGTKHILKYILHYHSYKIEHTKYSKNIWRRLPVQYEFVSLFTIALLLNTFVCRDLPHTEQWEGVRLSGSNLSIHSITEENETGVRTMTLVSAPSTASGHIPRNSDHAFYCMTVGGD